MNKILLSLVALPLVLSSCKEAEDAAKNAQNGISNAAGSAMDASKDAMNKAAETIGSFSTEAKAGLVKKLNDLMPQISTAVDSLKAKAADLPAAAAEKLKQLGAYKDQLPQLIESLKNGGADVWTKLSGQAGELIKNVPALLNSLKEYMPK